MTAGPKRRPAAGAGRFRPCRRRASCRRPGEATRGTAMLTRPELKSCSRVEILDDRHVILLAERDQHLLTGSAFVFLVPLLDGSRTVEEIVGAGVEAGRVSAPEAYYCLERLEALQ